MVFKRRTPKSWALWVWHLIWPQGGWGRAVYYVAHRLNRLPDSPHRIARGIFAGVFTTFTPFYGLHFVVAATLARLSRGNILASLTGTFFGNPLTYIPIGIISLKTGYFMLGIETDDSLGKIVSDRFSEAGRNLWFNFRAIFNSEDAQWDWAAAFYSEVFFPYMIGGLIPGLICGIAGYYISLPVVTAYQNRRKGLLRKKLAEIREKKALKKAKDKTSSD